MNISQRSPSEENPGNQQSEAHFPLEDSTFGLSDTTQTSLKVEHLDREIRFLTSELNCVTPISILRYISQLSKERSKGVDRDKIVRSASDSQPAELEKGNRSNSIQKVFKALRSMRERSRLKGAVRKALKELENRGYISQRVDYVTSSCLDRDFCSRGLSESAVEGRFSGTLSDARGCGVLITRYFSTPLGNKLVHYCKGKERE